jgi:hypothetical protein
VTLFVCSNLLQVSLGEGVELLFDLLDVHAVVALDRFAARRSLFARLFGGLRVPDVLFALFGALALRFLRRLPLFGSEFLPGLLRQVTLRLTACAGLSIAFLGLPLFFGSLLQMLLILVLLALVTAPGLLVFFDQEL